MVGPGESLFIPEGWWHRVESDPGTAAVNIWWLSDHGLATAGAGGPHSPRLLWARQALAALVDEKRQSYVAELATMAGRTGQCGSPT